MREKIAEVETPGIARNSNSNSHRSATVLTAAPPEIVPTLMVVYGTSKLASKGPFTRCSSAIERINVMARAAYSMALTPSGVLEECEASPVKLTRYRWLLLCADTARMLVGSPTTQMSGRMPRAARSASRVMAPWHPTSSS